MSSLNLSLKMAGGGKLKGTSSAGANVEGFTLGVGVWDAIDLTLTNGTGSKQGNLWWLAERTVSASANDDLDLAGVLVNGLGQTATFTKVKLILVQIDTPDGTKKLRIGPAASNGFVGPFGGTTPYEEFTELKLCAERFAGWTVTAGTGDVLRISNPGAGPVTYRILIVGY